MIRSATLFLAAFGAASLVLGAGCSSSDDRTSFDDPGTPDDGTKGTGDGGAPADDSGTTPQPDKPGCASTKYSEPLPTNADLPGSFSPATAQDYLLSALDARYPIGKFILNGGLTSPLAQQQGNCFDRFTDDKSSADGVLRGAQTSVHECGHIFDLGDAKGSEATYHIRPDLSFTCDQGDTTSRGGVTVARSRIKGDDYYAKRPACGGQAAQGCDIYADIYLDGDPDDSDFQGGDQGYNSVLEEATQYVNSLATALAFEEVYQGSRTSERDGILTFLWYIERYLAMAKTDYPQAYDALTNDACWRQATLSVWDRGWFFLNATKGKTALGIDDAAIEPLVKDPKLTAEIDALRALECK